MNVAFQTRFFALIGSASNSQFVLTSRAFGQGANADAGTSACYPARLGPKRVAFYTTQSGQWMGPAGQ